MHVYRAPAGGSTSDLRGFASDMSVGGGPMASLVSNGGYYYYGAAAAAGSMSSYGNGGVGVQPRSRKSSGASAYSYSADAGYASQPMSRRGSQAVRTGFFSLA